MILITGASGKTGKAVIKALNKAGKECRAMVRRKDDAENVKGFGAAEVFVGDLIDKESLQKAAEGVDAIYHICPNMHPLEIQIGENIIQAALAAKVNHFVYHSVLRPQIEAMPHHWNKMRVEEKLYMSGLNYTVLQPAAYFQNILGLIQDNVLRIPYNVYANLSMVDLGDIAEAAAQVIREKDHFGAVYELCADEPISHAEIAALLGDEYRAEQINIKEWRDGAEKAGLGEYQITTLIKMFDYYQKHGFIGNGNILRWLLGREPNTIKSVLNKKAGA